MKFARRHAILAWTIGLAVAAVLAAEPEPTPPATTPAAFPLTAYAAVGSSLAETSRIAELGWTDAQVAAFLDGVRAAIKGKGFAFDDSARLLFEDMGRRIGEVEVHDKQYTAEALAQPGRFEQYMKEMRKRYSLQLTESGLAYCVHPGRGGVRPQPGDTVVVSCVATAADGTTQLPQLASNRTRVKMANLLPGFMEGLQMMTVDSQAIFLLPPALSFGDGHWPEGVARGTPLIFELTLHEVISGPTSPSG